MGNFPAAVMVVTLILSSSGSASEVPGYQNGRCRILQPETWDRAGFGCDKGRYAVLYDGYIVDVGLSPCNSSLEDTKNKMDAISECQMLPAYGLCTLLYPTVVNRSGTYCEKGWTFTTFDGDHVDGKCYRPLSEAFKQMVASPACAKK